MLSLLFEPERVAYKFGKWRGPLNLLVGFGFSLVGFLVKKIFLLVVSMGQSSEGLNGTPLWIVISIFGIGALIISYGFWLIYQDLVNQKWRIDAEMYRQTRW